MLQDTLNILRRQFLGLNRILSTVMELVSEGLTLDDEQKLLEFATNLLINNHNFQFCTIHVNEHKQLRLAAAHSAENMLSDAGADEGVRPWVQTCGHLAGEVITKGDGQLLKRHAGESIYYSMPILYRGEFLGVVSVNSPGLDENHPKLVQIFTRTLTSVLINARQSQHLNAEVARRTQDLETAWRVAEESLNAKSQFLTNMSHEYRTPLNAIVAAGSLLLETNLNKEQKEYAHSLHDSAEGLTGMVNAMLDYSQTENGELEIHPEPVNLRHLVEDLAAKYRAQALPKNIDVELLLSPEFPSQVLADPNRLSQVLNNLLGNAVKFTNAGKVTLDVSCEADGDRQVSVSFCVLDTGIGIDATQQDSVFHPFSQANSTNSRPFQGAGLGLTISQHLINLMGGHITLQSAPDKGSLFSFSLVLPLLDDPLQALTSTTPFSTTTTNTAELLTKNKGRMTVLLVEDNLINQKLAARLLEKMGCQVDVADDGEIAVNMFGQRYYDMVFMDCQMPNMDGFEATSKIRMMETNHRTPIIALTANSLPEDRARSFAAGMDEFLTKPIMREKLKDALTKWAESS